MYQKTKIALDWIAAISIYSLVLLIIPISNLFLGHLNEEAAAAILNTIINILISLVFLVLFVYLIKKGDKARAASYIWLITLFIITVFFLMRVQAASDRLHFLGYGILSLFLYRALRHNIGTQMLYVWSIFLIITFAVLDEFLQISGLGGRSFEFKDILIDSLSSLVGQCIIALVIRPKLETVDIKIRGYMKGLEKIKIFRERH